jgi:ATP-dependent DNA helicase RecQ
MYDNREYGKLAGVNEVRMKQMIQKLLLDSYLIQSNDKYGLLRVGRKLIESEALHGNSRVLMKVVREEIKEGLKASRKTRNKTGSKANQTRASADLTPKEWGMFDEMKALRMKLARAEGMPPYIIFSDKTLVEMCVKLPKSREEMLQVSGVGEYKFEKYGEQFLTLIQGNLKKLSNKE